MSISWFPYVLINNNVIPSSSTESTFLVLGWTNSTFYVYKHKATTFLSTVICNPSFASLKFGAELVFFSYHLHEHCHWGTELCCSKMIQSFHTSFSAPQFRYKTRVYKQTNLDEKALAKLSTKVFFSCLLTFLMCDIHFQSLTSFFVPLLPLSG